MKATALHGIGNLVYENINKPKIKKGEVLVKIKASGICGSDIPRIFETGTYHFPTVPGHEMAGVIDEVADDLDSTLIGKKVAIFPIIPCGVCENCKVGNYAQCENYDYKGSRTNGGFAEYIAAPIWNMCFLDDSLSFEEGAMIEPASVAAHAIRIAEMDLQDNVVIFGAGPIGLLTAKWTKIFGASKVMLIDIDERKLEFAKNIGFNNICNSMEVDPVSWVKDITKSGADVVIEASGSYRALCQGVLCSRNLGKVILLGNPASDAVIDKKTYSFILRKQLTLKGTWNSVYSDFPKNEWKMSAEAMKDKTLFVKDLVTHRTDLEHLNALLLKIKDKEIFFCKALIINE